SGGPAIHPGVRERKKALLREAFVAAALDLFARQGFDATRVEEIAEVCGVSKRTFFRYFATKADVLFADTARHSGELIELLRAQPTRLSSAEALRIALRTLALDAHAANRQRLLVRNRALESSASLRAYLSETTHRLGWHEAVLVTLREREDASESPLSLF